MESRLQTAAVKLLLQAFDWRIQLQFRISCVGSIIETEGKAFPERLPPPAACKSRSL